MARKTRILITGAGRRVGAAIARHLAHEHDLVLHYWKSEKEAKKLADACRKLGAHVALVKADLNDAASLGKFWKGVPACTGFIHNASSFARDTLATLTAQSLSEHLALHLEAPLLLAQGFMKQLPKKAAGSIIILGDGELGWSVAPPFFSYAVSKHAWASVIDVLASAVAPRARANVLALGATMKSPQESQKVYDKLARIAPLQRNGSPQEVAQAIDFLLATPGVTGQVISLANGFGLASFRGSKAMR